MKFYKCYDVKPGSFYSFLELGLCFSISFFYISSEIFTTAFERLLS